MWIKRLSLALVAALIGALSGGCGKSSPPKPLVLHPPPVETVAAIHWLGKQRLAADTNAAFVMSIWNLPESQKLEAQTLDRLAIGLLGGAMTNDEGQMTKEGRITNGEGGEHPTSNIQHPTSNALPAESPKSEIRSPREAPAVSRSNGPTLHASTSPASASNASTRHALTNPAPALDSRPKTPDSRLLSGPAVLLRPLLDDLVQQESFLEVREATNLPGDLTFAIRLSEERARLWETNLASVIEAVSGSHVAAFPRRTNAWQCALQGPRTHDHGPRTTASPPDRLTASPLHRLFALARAGEWTVLGMGHETNVLTPELLDRIQQGGLTSDLLVEETWLHADVDLYRLSNALNLDLDLPADLPRMTVDVTGDGKNVRTRGQFNFPKPLPADLPAWNIPTNLIHDPLCSFTAIRGIAPWLASWKGWTDLQLGPPPDQLYFWAQSGLPFLTFCAAPLPNASNAVYQLTERLVQKANPELATNGMGHFARATNFNGASWKDFPIVDPAVLSVSTRNGDFAFMRLTQDPLTNQLAPPALLAQVLNSTDLVAYDWELTGPRVQQWLFTGQLLRMVTHHAQMPAQSSSVAWLASLETNLANSVTAVTKTGPTQLSLSRRSTLGFTAVELHLLADWFESPQFPRGLHTFAASPEPLPSKRARQHSVNRAGTNAPAAGKR